MEVQYLKLLQKILDEGEIRSDRTGTGTIGMFALRMELNLSDGFPLLTTKEIKWRTLMHELLWFIRGDTNIRLLLEKNVHIWSEWPHKVYNEKNDKITLKEFELNVLEDEQFASRWGDLGPVYGAMWRRWPKEGGGFIDQLLEAQDLIRNNPNSRRIIISAWNPGVMDKLALPPCHVLVQFYVSRGKLDCHLYQRSGDMFLGVPFNIASYSMLTCMMAQTCGLEPGRFIHTLGDAHIYSNHVEQVKTQLSRFYKMKPFPIIKLNPFIKCITEFKDTDIEIQGYEPMPFIKAQVAV